MQSTCMHTHTHTHTHAHTHMHTRTRTHAHMHCIHCTHAHHIQVTEVSLSEAMCKALGAPPAPPPATGEVAISPASGEVAISPASGESGVWAGVGTARCGLQPARRRQLRMCASQTASICIHALHACVHASHTYIRTYMYMLACDMYRCGPSSTAAMHLVARLSDPFGSGISATRTLFLSNGVVPHHWQHRVFSDGEVFDPIVEP